jgi:hypothetical protein
MTETQPKNQPGQAQDSPDSAFRTRNTPARITSALVASEDGASSVPTESRCFPPALADHWSDQHPYRPCRSPIARDQTLRRGSGVTPNPSPITLAQSPASLSPSLGRLSTTCSHQPSPGYQSKHDGYCFLSQRGRDSRSVGGDEQRSSPPTTVLAHCSKYTSNTQKEPGSKPSILNPFTSLRTPRTAE